ncbi:hypothetical protein ACFL6O_06520 [candidate division KSB1 bacterium]
MQSENRTIKKSQRLKTGYRSCVFIISLFLFIFAGCFPDNPVVEDNSDFSAIKNVLFIGHSYTFWNNMPFMFQQMTVDSGEDTVILATMYTDGGASLQRFWNSDQYAILREINQGHYDYVFMQGIILEGEDRGKYAHYFDEEIDKTGAQTMLYLPWASEGYEEYQETINEGYYAVAEEIGAIVAPVGIGWHRSIADNPEIDLYDTDRNHPSRAGSYFAACIFYSVLYNKSPEGLPTRITYSGSVLADIPADHAAALQRTAWETVQEMNNKK